MKATVFIEENRKALDSIMLSIASLHYANLPIGETLSKSIALLQDYAKQQHQKRFLYVALLYIKVYMEFGFDYSVYEDQFNAVLHELDTSKEELFPKKFYQSKSIRLTKPQVRSVLGRWTASKYHSKTIGEVVEDIINKVESKEEGIYYYYSNHNPDNKNNNTFELCIQKNEIFLRDVRKNKFYTFVR